MRASLLLIPTVAVAMLFAQEPAAKPEAPKPEAPKADAPKPAAPKPAEMPEDLKALTKARAETDPAKKIEMLRKMIADFPKSMQVESAQLDILMTLLKTPEKKDEIVAFVREVVDPAPALQKPRLLNTAASRMIDAGVLLPEAEKLAVESLETLNEKEWIADQKKTAVDQKRTVPPDAELNTRFRQMKGGYLSVLGRIYLKQGDDGRGEKNLKKSFKLNPGTGATVLALGELYEKKNNQTKALEYYTLARLIGGPATADAAKKLEASYRKTRNGNSDGLEEMLDAQYKKRFPNPVHADDYRPTAARTDRAVLVELFTGAGCPPCVSADLALDVALERYSRQELTLIAYHLHIPRPDPMTTTETQARQKYYDVRGVPSYYVDGERDGGGGPRENTLNNWNKVHPKIEKRLETASGAKLRLDAVAIGGKINVKAEVSGVRQDAKDVSVHLVLVEEHLTYSGENGIRFHSMVARSIAGKDGSGIKIEPSAQASVSHTFELGKVMDDAKKHLDDYEVNGRHGKITFLKKMHEIDPSKLGVVAFVQDNDTKEILQSHYMKLAPATVSQR